MAATFYTEWSSPLDGSEPDAKRHADFCAFAVGLIDASAPWLMPLLDASDAKVLLAPNGCSYLLPGDDSEWIEIPEIARRIQLLPWAEPGETAH